MKMTYTRDQLEANGFLFTGKTYPYMVGVGQFQKLAYELDVTQDSLQAFRTNIDEDSQAETWELYFTPNKKSGYISVPILNF